MTFVHRRNRLPKTIPAMGVSRRADAAAGTATLRVVYMYPQQSGRRTDMARAWHPPTTHSVHQPPAMAPPPPTAVTSHFAYYSHNTQAPLAHAHTHTPPAHTHTITHTILHSLLGREVSATTACPPSAPSLPRTGAAAAGDASSIHSRSKRAADIMSESRTTPWVYKHTTSPPPAIAMSE